MTLPRLLIVEDSALVSSAFRALFEDAGFDVATASNGHDGLASASVHRPDVMLLDLTLPDCNGLDLLRDLSAHDATPRATIAITGHDDDETRSACMAAGCAAVRVKPVPIRELVALVRSL